MKHSPLAAFRSRSAHRIVGTLAIATVGLLAPVGIASAGPTPGPTPSPTPTPSSTDPPQEQWPDEVELNAASICQSGDAWVAHLVITWSTTNPNQPQTSLGLFGAPGMNPKYVDWNGEPANGQVTYDFTFSAPTDLMVNIVWGMAEGNEQDFLTVSPGQQGDCGGTAEPTTTAVGPSSSAPAGGGSSTGGSSGSSGSSSVSAARLPSTGASAGAVAGGAAAAVAAGFALLAIARRRQAA